MTLVLGCLTPNYIIQVSDQRVTRISDGTLVDDLRNKGTIFCAQMGFAYTGLAEIDGLRTDLWLARVLATQPGLQAGIDAVAEHATSAFNHMHAATPGTKRHAFSGVGFCRTTEDGDLRACQIIVSNFVSRNGGELRYAEPTFDIHGRLLSSDRPFALCEAIGARVPNNIRKDLERNIRACVRKRTTPRQIMILLANAVRRVATFVPTVGKSLLIIFIPRSSVEKSPVLFMTPVAPSGLEKLDNPMFLHIPANSRDPYWDLPNFVCGGALAIGSFEQGVAPAEGTSPDPVLALNLETYRQFLWHSNHVRELAEFVESLGVEVDSLGLMSRDLDMLRQARIATVAQLEDLFVQASPWSRQLLSDFYNTWYAKEISEGKLSSTCGGIVAHLLIASYPQVFTAETLLHQYGWGLPERILSVAARVSPQNS